MCPTGAMCNRDNCECDHVCAWEDRCTVPTCRYIHPSRRSFKPKKSVYNGFVYNGLGYGGGKYRGLGYGFR